MEATEETTAAIQVEAIEGAAAAIQVEKSEETGAIQMEAKQGAAIAIQVHGGNIIKRPRKQQQPFTWRQHSCQSPCPICCLYITTPKLEKLGNEDLVEGPSTQGVTSQKN